MIFNIFSQYTGKDLFRRDQQRWWQRQYWGYVAIHRGRGKHWWCFWGRGLRPGCSFSFAWHFGQGGSSHVGISIGNHCVNIVSINHTNICGVQPAQVVHMTQKLLYSSPAASNVHFFPSFWHWTRSIQIIYYAVELILRWMKCHATSVINI